MAAGTAPLHPASPPLPPPRWRDGVQSFHQGDPADPRMRASAAKRGIQITSLSRPITRDDLRDFDLILAMDLKNRDDIMQAAKDWHKTYGWQVKMAGGGRKGWLCPENVAPFKRPRRA